jgi:hypothetical protein
LVSGSLSGSRKKLRRKIKRMDKITSGIKLFVMKKEIRPIKKTAVPGRKKLPPYFHND